MVTNRTTLTTLGENKPQVGNETCRFHIGRRGLYTRIPECPWGGERESIGTAPGGRHNGLRPDPARVGARRRPSRVRDALPAPPRRRLAGGLRCVKVLARCGARPDRGLHPCLFGAAPHI